MKKKILALFCVMGMALSSMAALPSNAQEETEFTYEDSVLNPSRAATYTYSVGGVNAEGHDFTPNVNYSSTIFGLMSSVSNAYKNTTPSYSYLSGNNPGGYKRLGSKIVLLTGHANATLIELDNNNGNTKVGVCKDSSFTGNPSGRKYYGLSNVSMSNTDLIMFFGCNTALGSSNLCTKSTSKGAKAAVGTTKSVVSRTGEGAIWVQRFIDGLYNGKSVANAGAYANNFVSSNCSMRTGWKCVGKSTTVVNSGGGKAAQNGFLAESNQGRLDPAIVEEHMTMPFNLTRTEISAEKVTSHENELSGVIRYLRGIDSAFDTSDYNISVNTFEDGTAIISFDYMIGDDISTDKGFTFVSEDGILTTLTYNKEYYDANRQDVDESYIQEIVRADISKNKILHNDENNHSYYTYSFASGKITHVHESFVFDGEVWIDNYSERILN